MSKKNNTEPIKAKKFNPTYWLVAVILIAFVAYSQSFSNEILNFDDNEYFEDYPEILSLSFDNTIKYFSNYYVLMYHPLPILSFAVQYQLTGLSTPPMHLWNFMFHVFNILLVYNILQIFFKQKPLAIAGALVFAIHPMNVEAVSWISARSSVMYGCFFLASLLSYLRYLERNQKIQLLLSIVFFLLSLLSKANAIALPLVIVLFDFMYRRRYSTQTVAEKIPYFALSIAFGLIALKNSGTTQNIQTGLSNFGIIDSLMMISYSLVFYIVKFFAPLHLSAIYTYPIQESGFLPIKYYLAFIAFVILTVLIFSQFKKRPYLFWGCSLFILVVSVTLQIIPSRLFLMADRYCYIPYLGFIYLAGHFYMEMKSKNHVNTVRTITYVFFGWMFFLFILTFQRNQVWKSTTTLVTDIIAKNDAAPYLSRAYGTLARERKLKYNDLQGALVLYNKAEEVNPNDALSSYNRGIVLFDMKRFDAALADFNKAYSLGVKHFDMHNYLGLCHFQLNQPDKALEHYQKSIALNPKFPLVYNNRGVLHGQNGDYEAAKADFTMAISLNPAFIDAYKNRGIVYLRQNNREKACGDLMRVRSLGSHIVDDLINANHCNE